MSSAQSAPTPQPSLAQRAATVARFPVGMAVVTGRYLWHRSSFRRSEVAGDSSDLPPALPEGCVDDEVKTVEHGNGPLFHRLFTVHMTDAEVDAAGLMARITDDLDDAAPSEVVTFRKVRGRVGELAVGDEYRVRIPAPWDGPVRVIRRDATSFRFTTLRGHLEAGQIEFRAEDEADGLRFAIETWSRAGTPLARVAFQHLRLGKEIQLSMWAQFCLAIPRLAAARRTGPVDVRTRRWDGPRR